MDQRHPSAVVWCGSRQGSLHELMRLSPDQLRELMHQHCIGVERQRDGNAHRHHALGSQPQRPHPVQQRAHDATSATRTQRTQDLSPPF